MLYLVVFIVGFVIGGCVAESYWRKNAVWVGAELKQLFFSERG